MHFVTAYEVVGDFLILGLLLALWKFRVFKRDGFLFFTYAALYSAMRFGISFLRLDKEVVLGLRMAQLLALGVIGISHNRVRPPARARHQVDEARRPRRAGSLRLGAADRLTAKRKGPRGRHGPLDRGLSCPAKRKPSGRRSLGRCRHRLRRQHPTPWPRQSQPHPQPWEPSPSSACWCPSAGAAGDFRDISARDADRDDRVGHPGHRPSATSSSSPALPTLGASLAVPDVEQRLPHCHVLRRRTVWLGRDR